MESEKVKEIKDCLLWNGDRRVSYTNTDFKKVYVFYDDILTLINELEKEKVCSHCQRIILGKDVYCLDCLNRFREIALKSFAERLKEKFNDTEYRAKTKRKTISIEELKAQMDWILHEVVVKNIDETLKEFIK